MASAMILRALTGRQRGQEFTFEAPAQITLGRSSRCAVRVPGDSSVSRQHCLVGLDDHGAWVQDLDSLNGTLVNGQKVGQRPGARGADAPNAQQPRHPLDDGDELRLCNSVFAVVLREGEGLAPESAADPSRLALSGGRQRTE
jgi:eukaryotic-like serine/threonine-protein kinase